MELIRRNTDYALRIAAHLANAFAAGKPLSARVLAKENDVSYVLACKLLQKLAGAGLVGSTMGPKGGFVLTRGPEAITFRQIIEAVQGPVNVNRCLVGDFKCPNEKKCPINPKLSEMQQQINGFLNAVKLAEFVKKKGGQTHG